MPLTSLFDDLGLGQDDRASILIVDDADDRLLVLRTELEDLGHELVCARSGREALKEVLKHEFAAILLDIDMPDIDGFETAGLIRRYKRSAHTPILFITSYADEMQTIRGHALGTVDYILSPVVPEILRSKVKVFVDMHLMQRRLRRHADERAELAAAETARRVAEANTRRSNFLSQAGRMLSASLDVEVAARQLLEMLVPQFAAGATLLLQGPQGEAEFALACLQDAAGERLLSRVDADSLPEATAQALRVAMLAADSLPLAAGGGGDVVWPLLAAGRSFGAVCVGPLGPDADRASIGELIERSAGALENARLYRSLQVELEERRAVAEQLQASNRRKDEFLAMLSRELRNPLAPIRTALEVIRRLAPNEPKLAWAMDVTGREVDHLTRRVEDLLDGARVNHGKIALQMEALDLRAVLAHGVETVRPFIEQRRHELVRHVPDVPVMLRGDFARLSQVIANLLNNAARYTEEGGVIELTLGVREGHALITVRDNGIGIDAELLPDVFEPFEPGKRSPDRSQSGLGVGLTLVQRVVGLHHGSVEARSAGIGLGSEFRVELRCIAEGGEPVLPMAAAVEAPALPRGRILVVDDNRDAAEATAALLELGGHEVKCAGDGDEALESAPVFAPDVVLLDIGLPGMTGYEVAVALRALPQTRSSYLIALTGYGQPADRQRARAAGFDHHLTKPADPDGILDLVAAWLAKRRGDEGAARGAGAGAVAGAAGEGSSSPGR